MKLERKIMKLEQGTKRIIHISICVITAYHLLIMWTAIRTVSFQSRSYVECDKHL